MIILSKIEINNFCHIIAHNIAQYIVSLLLYTVIVYCHVIRNEGIGVVVFGWGTDC